MLSVCMIDWQLDAGDCPTSSVTTSRSTMIVGRSYSERRAPRPTPTRRFDLLCTLTAGVWFTHVSLRPRNTGDHGQRCLRDPAFSCFS